ncbi:MAG: BLUF domain-containing protein [Chloroflexota bacterium]
MFITLIYGSTATRDMTDKDLNKILEWSHSWNASVGITGMLLYKGGNFLQVLEGEEEKVDALFNSISKDERHHGVSIIYRRPIQERSFDDWSMGFINMDAPPPVNKPGYSDYLQQPIGKDAFEDNPSHAHVFMRNFKEMMR